MTKKIKTRSGFQRARFAALYTSARAVVHDDDDGFLGACVALCLEELPDVTIEEILTVWAQAFEPKRSVSSIAKT